MSACSGGEKKKKVLRSIPDANLLMELMELILFIIVFVATAFPHARHPYVNLGKKQ